MAVFAASPGSRAIAFRQPREPSDLLNARSGQCFDRARTLDKALRFVGYQTRYVSIYKRPKGWSVLDVLLSPADRQSNEGVRSHAVVEVLTAQGWLFLDTVTPFISQDKAGKPISLAAWQNTRDKDQALWMPQAPPARLYPLLQSDFVQVVGLYSRHGMAYWPYVPLPDIDWFALPENI
jgi:transglutaminase-like putative cysteine protease